MVLWYMSRCTAIQTSWDIYLPPFPHWGWMRLGQIWPLPHMVTASRYGCTSQIWDLSLVLVTQRDSRTMAETFPHINKTECETIIYLKQSQMSWVFPQFTFSLLAALAVVVSSIMPKKIGKIEQTSNCICTQQHNLGLNICTGLSQGPKNQKISWGKSRDSVFFYWLNQSVWPMAILSSMINPKWMTNPSRAISIGTWQC